MKKYFLLIFLTLILVQNVSSHNPSIPKNDKKEPTQKVLQNHNSNIDSIKVKSNNEIVSEGIYFGVGYLQNGTTTSEILAFEDVSVNADFYFEKTPSLSLGAYFPSEDNALIWNIGFNLPLKRIKVKAYDAQNPNNYAVDKYAACLTMDLGLTISPLNFLFENLRFQPVVSGTIGLNMNSYSYWHLITGSLIKPEYNPSLFNTVWENIYIGFHSSYGAGINILNKERKNGFRVTMLRHKYKFEKRGAYKVIPTEIQCIFFFGK